MILGTLTTRWFQLHEMTASYSEISFDSQSSPPISELRSLIDSPDIDGTKFLEDSLEKMNAVGGRPDQLNLKNREDSPVEDEDVDPPSYHKAIGYLQLEGTVMQDGDMVLFVTEDLENKIKLSSPVTKKGEIPSFPGSRSSTPCLYRQALTPQLPLLDHNILNELEIEARKVATSVDALTENLAAILHSVNYFPYYSNVWFLMILISDVADVTEQMFDPWIISTTFFQASALTVGCLEAYRDAVCKTCDAVDHNIKSMYQLMAKCEELSKSMGPVYKLAEQMQV